MSINQLIAGGIQLPRFESPMNMMAQLSQLESAREANELRKMQMAQMQRQQEQEMGLMNALQSGQPLSLQQALLGGRTGLSAFELQQGQLEAQRKKAEAERLQRAVPFAVAAQRAVNTPVQSPGESDSLLMGARQELADFGISGPEIDQRFASLQLLGTPEARREGLMTLVSSIPGLEEMLTAQSQRRAAVGKTEAEVRKLNVEAGQVGRPQQFAPPELLRLMEARDALPEGSPARAELQKRIEALGKPSGVTIETPVPVVDPRTGQVTYATRQEALGKTPPQFMEGLTPRERQNREAKLPAAKTAVTAFDAKSDKLASQIEELIAHPGLNQITGLLGGRIVGITNEGRRAEALYKSIVAQGGFSELQAMRDASTTGGALGQVSNQEGQYLRDAFGVLQRTQSTEDLQKGLRDALGAIRSAQQRTREAFEDTYAYREGAAPAVAPPSRGSVGAEAPTGAGRQTALPMPTKKEDAVAGQVYQTSRGPARWDGKQFIPVSE
jgi:hypothetical protein